MRSMFFTASTILYFYFFSLFKFLQVENVFYKSILSMRSPPSYNQFEQTKLFVNRAFRDLKISPWMTRNIQTAV
jgi:hypothetical protein